MKVDRQEKEQEREEKGIVEAGKGREEERHMRGEGSLSTMTGSEVIVAGKFNSLLWTGPYDVCGQCVQTLPKSLTHASSRNLRLYPLCPSCPSRIFATSVIVKCM